MRSALLAAFVTLLCLSSGCAVIPQAAAEHARCASPTACHDIIVAFVHFEGQRVQLLVNEFPVFDGLLTTEDHSTGISEVINLRAPGGSQITLVMDGKRVESEVLASSTRSIAALWVEPYIHQSDTPDLMLD